MVEEVSLEGWKGLKMLREEVFRQVCFRSVEVACRSLVDVDVSYFSRCCYLIWVRSSGNSSEELF